MTHQMSFPDVLAQWQAVLSLVSRGTEVIITEDNKPVAKLVPLAEPEATENAAPRQRIMGLNPGSIWVSEDFDEPLPEAFQSGQPEAATSPMPEPKKQRVLGLHRGQVWVSDDFDDPLPDEFWLGKE